MMQLTLKGCGDHEHFYKKVCQPFAFAGAYRRLCLPALAWGPADKPTYEGIDVSEYQGSIDYTQVKESGVEIVYIRASVGQSFEDPYFLQNYQNAKAAGAKGGVLPLFNCGKYHAGTAAGAVFCFFNGQGGTGLPPGNGF